jgi:microcompartment protein CcmL/EutN
MATTKTDRNWSYPSAAERLTFPPEAPALGLIELSSIAQGLSVADEVVKKAPVTLLSMSPVSPGKILIVFAGDEASVRESHQRGLDTAEGWLTDELLIPQLHPQIIPAINKIIKVTALEATGLLETETAASCVIAADQAVKTANVQLMEVRLARGIGGKGYFTVTGALEEVEAALTAGEDTPMARGLLVNKILIPNPDPELIQFLTTQT